MDSAETKPKILYVDGDRPLRSLMEQELLEEGYDVRLACCGQTALKEIQRDRPDVVITEINLAGMDGIELCQKILSTDKRQRLIFYTTSSTQKNNFLTWSADGYVQKGIESLVALKAEIKRVMTR